MANRLVLYTRGGCHLCSEMLAVAGPVAARYGLTIEPVDIDADLDLCAQYNACVPVLELDGHEVARYDLDAAALERALAADPIA